jgi:lysophospholipase L1-like esterase
MQKTRQKKIAYKTGRQNKGRQAKDGKDRLRSLAVNLLLLFIVVAVMLALIEITLKILHIPRYSTPSDEYRRSNEVWNHEFTPNSYGKLASSEYDTDYYINSFGLRNKEIGNKTQYRILFIGDSFTEGVGVDMEQNIPSQFQSLMDSAGYDVEVINGGIWGSSPILEKLYLEDKLYVLKPDMVILDLDLSDVADDYRYGKIAVYNGSKVVAVPGSRVSSEGWRGNIEYLCMKYRFNICMLMGRSFYRLTNLDLQKDPNFVKGNIESDTWFLTRYNLTPEQKKYYNATFGYLKEIKAYCDSRNITFVLVTYPYGHQVNADEWKQGRARLYFDEYPVYSLEFFSDVAAFAKKNNIAYIDTYYKFNNTKEFPLFYSLDNHMTAKGYRLVAEGISEQLQNRAALKEGIENGEKKYTQTQ